MNIRRTLLICALASACVPFTSAWGQAMTAGKVRVEQPWARPTVQGQAGGGGFLRIVGGATNDRLLSGSTDMATGVELHTMSMEGDVMRMRQVPGIDIPAGQTVELKPGGLHVMFTGLKTPLKTGHSFPLTLRFEKAGEVKVNVQVQPAAPSAPSAPSSTAEHKR